MGVAPGVQVDIRLWRNADHNETQGAHGVDITHTIMVTAQHLEKAEEPCEPGDFVAKAANKDLTYIGVSGDGDSLSIGMGQFAHVIRRNLNMCYMIEKMVSMV